ncbi:PP2C family protein-serine/threonine phosphatase [Kibdelosporangium lantanae]
MFVVGSDGQLVELNEAAELLFTTGRPGVALADVVPSWLAEAHRDGGHEPVQGMIAGRAFQAHATHLPDGVAWWLVDVTEAQRARRLLEVERERTAFLAHASGLLLSSMNLGRCMELTAQLAVEYLADAAVVILPPKAGKLTTVRHVRGGPAVREVFVADSATVPGLDVALKGFPPVPSRWIDPASVADWVVPHGLGPVGSVAVVPLPGQGVPAGALVLLRTSNRAAFSENEEVVARLFAARAGAAMAAARLYAEQASITEILMRDLVPPRLGRVDDIEFAGGYQPSGVADRVGGDFYDLHPAARPGTETFLVLGDVCGKGLEAAAMTGKIRNTLHALLPLAVNHQRILTMLNSALLSAQHTRFATLVLASAVRDGPNVRLRLTNAGHLPPLVLRNDGTVEEARTQGSLVGALPSVHAQSAVVHLAPGRAASCTPTVSPRPGAARWVTRTSVSSG